MLYPIFLMMLSEPVPFLRNPLFQKPSETTHKIYDHNYYTRYHTRTVKNRVSYFTSLTLIFEPPTFLTRGGGYQGFTIVRTSFLQQKRRRR
jgi:hypothetical protein